MSRAIDRHYQRRRDMGLDSVHGDGMDVGTFVQWLSMLSSGLGGAKKDDAAKQQLALQAAIAKKQAEDRANTMKMLAVGGGVLGLAGIGYLLLRKR
jgi:hypothetical protein